MAVWTDKSLICLWCCTACHQHQQQQQLLSHTLLIFIIIFSRWEWMNPLCNSTFGPVRGRSANVVLMPGAQSCSCLILLQTHRQIRHICVCVHEHTATLISRQAKRAGGQEDGFCLNISFSTAGGCWTCSIHQTSIKVSVWVMRPDSQGDHTTTLSASRSAWWPSVWAKKDQRQTHTD